MHWSGKTEFIANKADFERGATKSVADSGDEPSFPAVAGLHCSQTTPAGLMVVSYCFCMVYR